jgi:hypothetical protein
MQLETPDREKSRAEALKRQVGALRSGNRSAVLAILEEIRSAGDVRILPEIFDLLLKQDDQEILHQAARVLNDLKVPEAAAVLADAVKLPAYRPIQQILVAACWQNGLNYGPYAEVFVTAALEGSLETSIEAFSVLEEAVGELELAEREELARKLRHELPAVSDEKQALLSELIKVIDSFQNPQNFRLSTDDD